MSSSILSLSRFEMIEVLSAQSIVFFAELSNAQTSYTRTTQQQLLLTTARDTPKKQAAPPRARMH